MSALAKKPVVAIDARMLGPHGIGAYVVDLLDSFASMDHEFQFRVIYSSRDLVSHLPRSKFHFVAGHSSIYSLREQWEIARLARGVDLLHCPHYNIPYVYGGRLVVTIHDVTHLACRTFLPSKAAYFYARFMLGAAARHARRLITVSEFSRKAIQTHFTVPDERIRVIYRCLPMQKEGEQPSRTRLPELRGTRVTRPYILFVGTLKPHKNVQVLLRAFSLLPQGIRNSYQVIIAGKLDTDYPRLLRLTKQLSLNGEVVFAGQVSQDELQALYSAASLFVLPSLNEGFGLPALEAMAYGVPVIVSSTSSLPEVVGGAGILVNPGDEQDIARSVERVLSDSLLRDSMSERGRARAKQFSVREFAERHLEVYREALGPC